MGPGIACSFFLEADRITEPNEADTERLVYIYRKRLRRLIASNKEILEKVEKMERKYDEQFKVVFDAIRKLLTPSEEPSKRRIGFGTE